MSGLQSYHHTVSYTMTFLLDSEQVSTLGVVEFPDVFDAIFEFCERAGNFLNPLYSPILDKVERTLTFNAKIITESQDSVREEIEMENFNNIETQEPMQEDLSLGINCINKQQESTQDQLPSLNSMEDFTTIWSSNEDDTTEMDWTLICEENIRAESINTTQDDFILVEDEDFAI